MPMYDFNSLNSAGVPLTDKMLKYGNSIDQYGNAVRPDLLKFNLNYDNVFAINRNQNFVETIERYMWTNIPFGLTQDLIERLLYFRGKGIMYFNDKVDKFQFLPFALNGVIDEYGRFTRCNTLPFTGVDTDNDDTRKGKNSTKSVQNLVYEELPIVYDLPYDIEHINIIRNKKPVGIILNDSTLVLSQQPVIRSNYVRPILHTMSLILQIINTAIFGVADHNVIQVETQDEMMSINQQINAINQDILSGKRFTPIVGKFPISPLKTTNSVDLEGLFNTFNSLNNFLKSITGVANSGVFDKKAHLLQSEQQLNGSNADDVYYNGLRQRQEFCLLFQAYYNYPIWCESKRGMTTAQAENVATGETSDPDNTQYNDKQGGLDNDSK
jgi:hypothetical protein